MSLSWILLCVGVFLLLVLAYIPASIAARKDRTFSLWYLYGILLFPIALIHAKRIPEPDYFTLKRELKPTEAQEEYRYTIIHTESTQHKLVDFNAPIDVLSYEILESTDHKKYLNICLRNLCFGTATSILLSVSAKDKSGQPILMQGKTSFPLALESLDLPRSTLYYTKEPLALPSNEIHTLSFVVTDVYFSDAPAMENKTPHPVCYQATVIDDYDEILALKEITGHAACLPQQLPEGWVCICGRLNQNKDATCLFCNSSKAMLFETCTEAWLKKAAFEGAENRKRVSEENKRLLAEKEALEKEEAEIRYAEIAARKEAHSKRLRHQRNIALSILGGVLLLCGITYMSLWLHSRSTNKDFAIAAEKTGQYELARDYYGLAGVDYTIENSYHATNTDSAYYFKEYPTLADVLPNDSFICDIYDGKVLYRNSDDGMDKEVYVYDTLDSSTRFLLEYEEKSRGYCVLANDFVTIESNRLGDAILRFTDLDSAEQQTIRFPVSKLAVTKTTETTLLVRYEADYDGSTNYFEVYQDLFGDWKSHRILESTYQKLCENTLYQVTTVE